MSRVRHVPAGDAGGGGRGGGGVWGEVSMERR